jgi:FlaA1/EpsC-like NDP-sugar epimerase
MYRTLSALLRTLVDVTVLSVAYFVAYFIRFDAHLPLQMLKLMVFTWPYTVAFELLVLHVFSVPQFAWRYVGLREAQRVLWATAISSFVLLGVRISAASMVRVFDYAEYALVPIGCIAANAVLSFLFIIGVRFVRRISVERSRSLGLRPRQHLRVPTLLLGAGQAGVLIAKEIQMRPDLPIAPLGFLDDDSNKLGMIVHGVKVLGTTADLAMVTRATGARQAIITIADASSTDVRRIAHLCEDAGIPVKIIPGLFEILEGKVNLTRIRDVSIEDLLGREAVSLDLELVSSLLAGKRVLVTGAGGSIGSELCRQVARFKPAVLTLVEQTEFNLFSIHQELQAAFPNLTTRPMICDVCDSTRVDAVFAAERPQVVFHAAAHKHVPMMEWNPGEALKNNVFGTKKVADAAHAHASEAFVMISTDKAVNPTSIMGATKRAAEIYIQALSQVSATKFVAVRFGNVLGSTGSVIPIFKAQIAAGGPVKVTHPEMKRYFMTIPEASQLVMQAGAMGETGEILFLDMGVPVRIADLAVELIRLSGFEPDVDIKIVYTGVREGEKLFEELAFDAEQMSKTRHEKVFVGKLKPFELADVSRKLDELAQITHVSSRDVVRDGLRRLVLEMRDPVDEHLRVRDALPAHELQETASQRLNPATVH